MTIDAQGGARMLEEYLRPWEIAISDPGKAQEAVLNGLLSEYARTDYGRRHGAQNIDTIADYRRAFPIKTYDDHKPLIEQVMAGDIGVLLWEEPVGWAITRGTTKGKSKLITCFDSDTNPFGSLSGRDRRIRRR